MNFIIFIAISIIYWNMFHRIYNANKNLDGLKVSFALSIFQALSYLGNFSTYGVDALSPLNGRNTTAICGNIAYAIGQNIFIIIALIIIIFKKRRDSRNSS